jgi:hypothetical protein
MENYSFLKYSDYDKSYYTMLYDTARKGGLFEGKLAVDFLKLSEISPVSWIYKFYLKNLLLHTNKYVLI